jgi:hypothetical protein
MGRILATPVDPTLRFRKRTKSDLAHLRALPGVEPATSTGRVAWIWPEIEAGLATGKKLREVWDAVRADGLDIPIRSSGSTYRAFEAVDCANARGTRIDAARCCGLKLSSGSAITGFS